MTELIKIPLYEGYESEYEDIVYSYYRKILNDSGYSFKVKRTGFPEIDSIIPSFSSGTKGRGSCDGYIFSSSAPYSLVGLLELETTGNIETGITQIQNYASGFISPSLSDYEKEVISKIERRKIALIVYDGKTIYLSEFDLDKEIETIIFNKLSVADNRIEVSNSFYSLFGKKDSINRDSDEREIIVQLADKLRGHEKLQKNKALLMTILASIFGSTKRLSFDRAINSIKESQIDYDKRLYETWIKFEEDITEQHDTDRISELYGSIAPRLFELSQDQGMDLYGFIYEELASKESKKEQGEYYTPRRTIRPLIRAIFHNYLNWKIDSLEKKIVFDPFCGSGGFLYEYITLVKSVFNLGEDRNKVDEIARKSLWGTDKNNTLSAYLNLFLIGDGSANLHRVKTSINWRRSFLYNKSNANRNQVVRIADTDIIKGNLRNSYQDLQSLIKMYVSKDFNYDLDKQYNYITENYDCLNDYLYDELGFEKTGQSFAHLGNVDLLLTNIPYGDVTDATEQFIENGTAIYGNSLEANGLRECIDFLRPAKQKNGTIIEEGGIALAIVPDSVLENPSNKPIRDYLVTRCNILAIIGLPPYTFAPYAMEKTYALVFQKIAPEQFDYMRSLEQNCFMYYSICDGKANSQNRYKTDLLTKSTVVTNDLNEKETIEYLHNDFEPSFEPFLADKYIYKSKLEWAWDFSFASKNRAWDQKRVTDEWSKDGWVIEQGDKWGYFPLVRYERDIEKKVKMQSLERKILGFLSSKGLENLDDYLGCENYEAFCKEFCDSMRLTTSESKKLQELSMIKYVNVLGNPELQLIKKEVICDIDILPDSSRYLGKKEQEIEIERIREYLSTSKFNGDDDIIEFFKNKFVSHDILSDRLLNSFDVIQGTQFSKHDAYLYPGDIPVFTAATNGPAYYVNENVPNKVKIRGPSLIWSRKGAKAGTIQLYLEGSDFYISDVSGVIKPRQELDRNTFVFLKYYISGQVQREIQSKANNAQLNKTKLENLIISLPKNMSELGDIIIKIKRKMKAKEVIE